MRLLSLAAGEPAIDCFPGPRFAIDHALKRCRRGLGTGRRRQPVLREAIAGGLGCRLKACSSWRARSGLDLLARCLVDPGDAVIIDRPDTGAIQFSCRGRKTDRVGCCAAEIDDGRPLVVQPKLIYTNPTFQNPTGATMPIRHDARC
jgi:DNA-binding transcriptional MocR family regulator